MGKGEPVAETYEVKMGRKLAEYHRKKRRQDEKRGKKDGKTQEALFGKE